MIPIFRKYVGYLPFNTKLKLYEEIIAYHFLFSCSIAAQAQNKNFIDQPYIEVSGTADTLVVPNEIFIRILVSEKDTRDRISVEELEGKMVAALKSLGIDTDKDLMAADMISNFKQYLFRGRDIVKTRMYVLKVRHAEMASQVFLKLEETGISNVIIERVDHTEMQNIRNSMLARAIYHAKAKAVAMTQTLGQTVGSAIHITENPNLISGLQGRVGGIQIRGNTTIEKDKAPFSKIDFEPIPVKVEVNVKFMLITTGR